MKRFEIVAAFLLIALTSLIATRTSAADVAPTWTPPVIDMQKWNIAGTNTILYDTVYKKVYVGTWYDWQRKNLLVFDVDKDGKIFGEPRRYIDHPDALPNGHWSMVSTIFIDRRHHRLWMGIGVSQQTGFTKPMVTYALDDKGEPTGQPEAYDNGNQYHSCQAFVLHPKIDRLYTSGWGSGSVWAFDLDKDGKPVKGPITYDIGGIGKYSMTLRPDGSKLYLGTHPGTLCVTDMNVKGEPTGKLRYFAPKDPPPVYLYPAINARGAYFAGKDNKLWYYRFDEKGEPMPDVIKTEQLVQGIGSTAGDKLVLAEPHTFNDAITGKLCIDGSRLKEISLQADGSLGAVLRTTKGFPRQEVKALSLIPNVAVAVNHIGWGFLGNRFAGISLRATLLSLEADGSLPPDVKTVVMNPKPTYLAFAYSPTRHMVYSAFEGSVSSYSLKNTENGFASVPCADVNSVIALDDSAGRLFVGKKDGSLALFTLGNDGRPVDTGKTVVTGVSYMYALRVNPQTHQVYVFGQKQPGLAQTPGTEDKVIPIPFVNPVNGSAVDPARGRLYAASAQHDTNNIWVWKLTANGKLSPDAPKTYADGIPQGDKKMSNTLGALCLDSKRNRLYTGGSMTTSDGRAWVITYTLDKNGDPTGDPRPAKSAHKYGYLGALALANNGSMIYEGGFGDTSVCAHALDANGDPKGDGLRWEVTGFGKSCLAMTADSKTLLIGDYPSTLDMIPMQADGKALGGLNTTFSAGDAKPVKVGSLVPGRATAWVNLDDPLKDKMGIATGRLTMEGAKVKKAVIKVEVARAQGGVMQPLATVTTTELGNQEVIFLPHYGMDEVEKIAETIQTTEMRFKRYLEIAKKNEVKPEDRPKQFLVANGLILMDASPAAMEYGMQTLTAMGHNSAQIWQLLPGEMIRDCSLRNGVTRFRGAIYNPPSYFDYDRDLLTPEALDKWLDPLVKGAKDMGARLEEVGLYHIGDEPGWYFPGRLDEVKAKPERLAVFREFLQSKGMTPQLLGKTTWDQVMPSGLGTVTDLPSKRLYYWTCRFYAETASISFAKTTAAFQRRFNGKIFTSANFNNWPGHWFIPSPGKAIANNTDTSPNAAYGMPDWFDFGRRKAVSCIWTEDWFGDKDAQNWSMYADLMRCAAREGNLEFGGYPVGHVTGHFEDGGVYKIMAIIGHGGKAIDPYIFGPNAAFGDGWSEKPAVYKSLSDGIRMMGKSERLTYPGRPRNGTVAILIPTSSQVWDPNYDWRYYINELYGLHAALIHQSYPVDFVDDRDLEDGALMKYGYSALYITGPNLSLKAQQAVLDWVNAGGTLAMLPGASQADEYNEPTTLLSKAMGASWPKVERISFPRPEELRLMKRVDIAITDGRFGTRKDVTALQTAPLILNGAKALATFPDGKAAITEMTQGNGRILAYGYWTGSDYWASPNRNDWYSLPANWAKDSRLATTAPARIANTKKYTVIDTDLVEGALLESNKGIAVTLLNWSGKPLDAITVTMTTNDRIAAADKAKKLKVSGVRAGALKYEMKGMTLTVTLPLKTVDVLMIEL